MSPLIIPRDLVDPLLDLTRLHAEMLHGYLITVPHESREGGEEEVAGYFYVIGSGSAEEVSTNQEKIEVFKEVQRSFPIGAIESHTHSYMTVRQHGTDAHNIFSASYDQILKDMKKNPDYRHFFIEPDGFELFTVGPGGGETHTRLWLPNKSENEKILVVKDRFIKDIYSLLEDAFTTREKERGYESSPVRLSYL